MWSSLSEIIYVYDDCCLVYYIIIPFYFLVTIKIDGNFIFVFTLFIYGLPRYLLLYYISIGFNCDCLFCVDYDSSERYLLWKI